MSRNSRDLTLYAHPDTPDSHRIRLVLAEKGVSGCTHVEVREDNEDLAAINPYNTVPTLVDRGLVLYDQRTILEYLDERYPQPALMPVDPAQRARYRMILLRLDAELYAPSEAMEDGTPAEMRKARARMQDALTRLASDLLPRNTLGEAYSLLDCALAPILWRMAYYRLQLPIQQQHLLCDYAQHLFQRRAFARSLTSRESTMQQPVAC